MQSIRHPQPYPVLPSQLQPSHHAHHPPPAQDSRTQLFVNNLPFRVRWQDLKDLFRKAGTVLRADVSLTPDNRSKGFGTVLFANRNDAFKAIEIYNGFSWQTRILDVKLDQQDPTGAFGMAAAAAACPAPSSQPKNYHQHPHPPYQQYPQMTAVSQHNHNHYTQPHNSLQLPLSTGNPSNAQQQNRNGPGGTTNTTLAGDPHQSSSLAHPHHSLSPAQLPSVIPAQSSTPFPAGQHSNSESLNPATNKTVHSYQKHQHSQSLIPFSDLPPNLSQSVFTPLPRTSAHRPSRSVQLSNPHPPSNPATSSTASPSQTPPSRPLDVHQPAFQPGSSSLNQALAHLQISTVQPALPCVTISTAPPDSSSSVSSAPVDTSSPVSSPAGSVSHHYSGATHSSLVGSNSQHDGPNIHHPSMPPFQHYGPPHSYPPHHIPGTTLNHAPYSTVYSQNSGPACRLLFVGNLPFNLQWQDLKDLFRQAGNILRADVATTVEGRSRGFGTVLFATAEDALKALEMYDGYELKGRALKVRFDQLTHPGSAAPGPWPEHATIPPPHFHPIHHGQYQSNHPLVQEPKSQTDETDYSIYGSTNSAEEKRDEPLWAPEPVRPSVRVSVPTIVPPALSPIASRRSSYFKPTNGSSEYSQTSSDGGQGTNGRSGGGPEPIGHPANQPRPQTIPMPPPYAPGLVSPALPKTIQMTPSMPAFSFQPFMPATPPLLPNFFSPGIGPPPTPPYGRDSHTPPPPVQAAKPVHSPLGYNPMFPSEPGSEDGVAAEAGGGLQPLATDDDDEGDEERGGETKPMDSNVDWGYQSASLASNRRTSLFVGRSRPPQGVPSPARLAPRGGFAGRRLLGGVGEEADEDGLLRPECASRRASFDVSSLFNSQQPSPPTKLAKQRPSDILISCPDKDPLKPASLPPPATDLNNIERVDLVGLGFVDSIWTDKQ
ncbi:hypothetical protein, variant [Puccinia triticina 1-1 BBBD Race 1]|uniref:RRM domain-containing protein n=1 Tax=Puccinia triticina (isolate 1-1 / race 1 (BBBD)) TaxID=630390 RepID=A0A180GPZ1_PUCT1|nr:hypothetical protein, variant [Puccinia triticina 1-1 BBBD Race 1]